MSSSRDSFDASTIRQSKVPTVEEAIRVLQKLNKWAKIESMGRAPIHGTRIIPCKTPIGSHWMESFETASKTENGPTLKGPHKQFDFCHLRQELARRGTPLGLIVDISNHTPLYEVDDDVQYVKIACISKQLCDVESVQNLRKVLREFYDNPANENKYVVIHCSYGRNRTGVMVVSYLVEELGMDVNDALRAFSDSRPPGIKHKWMIDDLIQRYNDLLIMEPIVNAKPAKSSSSNSRLSGYIAYPSPLSVNRDPSNNTLEVR
eukprot:TRINITY_DN231_c0_g1_i1.p1 TRINITY_DN231_c0_g1~~TRINITY_DN231_c0_g1_i1.p1  ORF type:complete len:262 (-),score=37.58 TRINITY_DN231_c0_g1_i1:214-999(-)